MIPSYPKVMALGHPQLAGLLDDPVIVEEKIDGSQFSARVGVEGELECRSRGKQIVIDAPDKMFEQAVRSMQTRIKLMTPGWVYRFEYLQKPKHNVLTYDRVPTAYLILYDVETEPHIFLDSDAKEAEAENLELECVPLLLAHQRITCGLEGFLALLDQISCLGGTKIEGVVIKNYTQFTRDGKVMMGKHVSESFKEVHNREWKKANPSGKDILGLLSTNLRTEARWAKSVQHLAEAGRLEHSPRDIGMLIKAVQADVEEECREMILQDLWKWAWPKLARSCIAGLPEYYKSTLLERQFAGETNERCDD